MVCWGITSACQFFITGRSSFLACRAIIGLLQGSFIPDIILYLSYYYKGTELPLRLALLWTADRFKDVAAPLIAFGCFHLRGVHGREGWRWLFLVEGLINVVVGVWAAFTMCPSPTQSRTWFRPKGWFNEKEEKILVNRLLRDDPSKGDMHNRQPVNLKMMWHALKDYDMIPIYLIGITFVIPAGVPKAYLTLTLRSLKFSSFETSLLSIPSAFMTSITVSNYLSPTTIGLNFPDDPHHNRLGKNQPTRSLWPVHAILVPTMPHRPGRIASHHEQVGYVWSSDHPPVLSQPSPDARCMGVAKLQLGSHAYHLRRAVQHGGAAIHHH